MKKYLLFLLLPGLGSATDLFAQFTLSAELRPRFEARYGYSRLPGQYTSPAFFVSQRSRLSSQYRNNNLTLKFTFQEIRTWGDEMVKSKAPTVGIYESWADWKLTDSLSLKLGRQELSYDNDRLFSPSNWPQAGQVHDAAVLKLQWKGWKADLGAAFNQTQENVFETSYDNTLTNIAGNYKSLNYIWLTKNFEFLRFSVFGITDGFQKPQSTKVTYLRATYGVNVYYTLKGVTLTGRAYLQGGKTETGKEISAFYLNPEATVNIGKTLTINPGAEIVSGKDYTKNGDLKYRCFSTLYGSGHKFMGHMDYFTNMATHTKEAGLVDLYLRIQWKYTAKISLGLDAHRFSLQNNYVKTGETKAISKNLGTEADLYCTLIFSRDVTLYFGYSLMFAQKSMEVIRGGDSRITGQWGFVSLSFKPTLFTSSNTGAHSY